MSTSVPRKPGRPRAQHASDDLRQDLIRIAGQLISTRGYEAVSLKMIASEAQVTPAMISYYFQGKAGLMQAVMEDATARLLQVAEAVYNDSRDQGFAQAYSHHYLQFMADNNWVVQLFAREVLTKDSESRRIFVENFGTKALALLAPRIREDQENGLLRADLNADYTQLSLIGMCVFPFLAAPILSPLFDYQPDREFAQNYGKHLRSLFMHGAEPTTDSNDNP